LAPLPFFFFAVFSRGMRRILPSEARCSNDITRFGSKTATRPALVIKNYRMGQNQT
jgi:hypothetical protein